MILAAALLLSACSAAGALPTLAITPEQAVYRLGSGDQLKITVYGEERLSGTYPVNGEGKISFPLVEEIPAAGLSISEFEAILTKALGEGLLNNPNVVVEVTNYRPYYILGEVGKPGEYPFVDGLTIFSAVARAGGFSYRAAQKKVFIRHKMEKDEKLYSVDGSTPVQPGDTIRVPERVF
ncbi:polysaccharide biosynthesis/export family protein [Sphingopyxis sp. JAI128]|uniref:polysaccharide biosynthesis/export family protein n=1 Tax=Sphingopyxis sp. JAI128 TaxID=2723066 RepID=UPI0017DF1A3C|nr:polysaccharide biosynthesis/export family protein [Sphingopyxis sp. JAI128]MBB6427196.1 polysaccharide export outer membrane protein [Sphingopyxis sp. JAI128]